MLQLNTILFVPDVEAGEEVKVNETILYTLSYNQNSSWF